MQTHIYSQDHESQPRRAARVVTLVAVLVLLVTACGSRPSASAQPDREGQAEPPPATVEEEPSTPRPTPTAVPTTGRRPGNPLAIFAPEFGNAINSQNRARADALADFGDPVPRGPEDVAIEIEALRAEARAIIHTDLPMDPDDLDLQTLYHDLMEAGAVWIDGYLAGADALEAEIGAIAQEWDTGASTLYEEISEPIYASWVEYLHLCEQIAAELLELELREVNCEGDQ